MVNAFLQKRENVLRAERQELVYDKRHEYVLNNDERHVQGFHGGFTGGKNLTICFVPPIWPP